jgi:hypothetical protein
MSLDEAKSFFQKIVRYRRRMSIWNDEDAREIGESVRYVFTKGTDDDRANCELWLRFESNVADQCRAVRA